LYVKISMNEKPISSTLPPNRLIREKSPYLKQHARNPVDWYPWGDEAFEDAKSADKPVFLSIGYSACHWCHVMAHESFEDAEVARLMNEAFICIKVDREERPDIDKIYMTACQLLTGTGGWPLTVMMTPERLPFYAATYIPKTSGQGRMGMLELIPLIARVWSSRRHDLLNAAEEIKEALHRIEHLRPSEDLSGIDERAYEELLQNYDHINGGFHPAPKFPLSQQLRFLLRYWRHSGDQHALEVVEKTLLHMARGGIHDHVGGGFHRYSTDDKWLVPHFEKMLYDQALLALVYLEAYQATGNQHYARTADGIFSYVLRDLTSPEGPFYTAEDADSEGSEGKFYLWRYDEVADLLDREDREWVARFYNLDQKGNYIEESTGRRTGLNILHATASVAEFAQTMGISPDNLERRLEAVKQRLFAYRANRVCPGRDDKVLTDWNGLMIAALSEGARVLGSSRYRERAKAAIDFICDRLRDGNGRLFHCERNDGVFVPANLDDYAFFIWGLINYYGASFDADYLKLALILQQDCTGYFLDTVSGGYYFTTNDAENVVLRKKETYDGATPSGNGVTAINLIRLARLTGRGDLEADARRLIQTFSGEMNMNPSAHICLVTAVGLLENPSPEVVIVGKTGHSDTEALLRRIYECFLPDLSVLFRPADEPLPEISRLAPFTADMTAKQGMATAYVCRGKTCRPPTVDGDEMVNLLNG
jgi:uncharacterized protein YyaL (SSP411 family)